MDAHGGRIQHDPLAVGLLQGGEDPPPDAVLSPASEAVEDRVPRVEMLGQVASGGAGAVDPQDGVEEAAVVAGGATGVVDLAGEQVLDASEVAWWGMAWRGMAFFAVASARPRPG